MKKLGRSATQIQGCALIFDNLFHHEQEWDMSFRMNRALKNFKNGGALRMYIS